MSEIFLIYNKNTGQIVFANPSIPEGFAEGVTEVKGKHASLKGLKWGNLDWDLVEIENYPADIFASPEKYLYKDGYIQENSSWEGEHER